MSAAKMKTTASSATTATTDANERIRKQQQQQQQQQVDNIAYNFVSPNAGTANGTTVTVTQLNNPNAAPPSTSAAAPAATVPAVASTAAAGDIIHGGPRNHTRKMRSASGDDLKKLDKRRLTSSKQKQRHVKFTSPISKSKLRLTTTNGSKQLIGKSKSRLKTSNVNVAGSSLPPIGKTKSILKVKQTIVVKRKPGTNKVSKRLKKIPQGAQAEAEAAELSKLAKQFARKLPEPEPAIEEEAHSLPPPNVPERSERSNRIFANSKLHPTRSNSSSAGHHRNGNRTLKRRHSASTKHLPSGAGVVESGSVNVPAVRRFSPVRDRSFFATRQNVKVYDGTFGTDASKSFDIPATSKSITVAMVKEDQTNTKKESSDEQQQQVPNETTNNTAIPVTVANRSGDDSQTIEEMTNTIIAPVVMPIPDPTARSSSNNSSSNKGKTNEDSAAKASTEAAAVAGPSTSSQPTEDDDKDKEEDKDAKKKKNRCAECRKKVGLTGFQCRCGGLYCAVHRYSDKHDCTFNYREHGAQEIRRNNPVVVGEKIQKI